LPPKIQTSGQYLKFDKMFAVQRHFPHSMLLRFVGRHLFGRFAISLNMFPKI